MIGDAHHRTVKHDGRHSTRLPVARSVHAGENAPQPFENELIYKAAAVVADVNDQPLFANLREKLLNESVKATVAHIRQIDVSHASVRRGVNLLAVALHPIQFTDIGFIRDRLHLHCMRSILRGLGIQRQRDRLVCGIHK